MGRRARLLALQGQLEVARQLIPNVIDPKQAPLYLGRGDGHGANLDRILKAQGKS
jgi:hypothetical protein